MNRLGEHLVVPLRAAGQKRARHEVLAATPIRGTLCLIPVDGPIRRRAGPHVAELFDFVGARTLLPSLDQAEIGKRRGSSFLVTGYEEVQEGRAVGRWPQVWWCRPVPAPVSVTGYRRPDDPDAPPSE